MMVLENGIAEDIWDIENKVLDESVLEKLEEMWTLEYDHYIEKIKLEFE